MTPYGGINWVNIRLMVLEPMTYHPMYSVAFTWEQFYMLTSFIRNMCLEITPLKLLTYLSWTNWLTSLQGTQQYNLEWCLSNCNEWMIQWVYLWNILYITTAAKLECQSNFVLAWHAMLCNFFLRYRHFVRGIHQCKRHYIPSPRGRGMGYPLHMYLRK